MKIKTKKEMNLPQLIEWGWGNPSLSRNKRFFSKDENLGITKHCVHFNDFGYPEVDNRYCLEPADTFTIEIEEELTEDTVIPKLMTTFKKNYLKGDFGYQRVRIDENYPIKLMLNRAEEHKEPIETLHVVNEDGTHTLIWTNEKGMIE